MFCKAFKGLGTGLPRCTSAFGDRQFNECSGSWGITVSRLQTDHMGGAKGKKRQKAKGGSWLAAAQRIPNVNMVAFEAAAGTALKLTKQYTTMPSDDELKFPDATVVLEATAEFLKGIPGSHLRSWQRKLNSAFPELGAAKLDQALQKLVVRCWSLRASIDPSALHDFVEFCAGQGNLTAECLKLRMYGLALDILYKEDHNMITRAGLQVMLDSISESKPGALNWWGTRCSSFVGMSRYHHSRSEENGFWGSSNYAFVRVGNMSQGVTALTVTFSYFCGCSPAFEQPTSSCMPKAEPMKSVLGGIAASRRIIWRI